MEKRIISIDISPHTQNEYSENAGVMWEHNATELQFKIDESYRGDYRYYIEYRSVLGTKVRTDYLELNKNDNTVSYLIPVTMSSLKAVECYFNIVKNDGDGNTIQVIKPKKFCLSFDFSPDTDNSLAKVNDFSINALLEAIRSGSFKGEKGDKGDIGEKGDKGDIGEVSLKYANSTFANAIKGKKQGRVILVDGASPVEHEMNIIVKSKNLWQGTSELVSGIGTVQQEINITGPVTVSCKRTDDFAYSNNGWIISVSFSDSTTKTISPSDLKDNFYSKVFYGSEEKPITKVVVRRGFVTEGKVYDVQVEKGETATEYTPYISDLSKMKLVRSGKNLWSNGDITVDGTFYSVVLEQSLPAGVTYTLSADVESTDTDHSTCYVYSPTSKEGLGQIERGTGKSITFTPKNPVDKITFYSSNYSLNGQGDFATFKNIQIEVGTEMTAYEMGKGMECFSVNSDGVVEGVKSIAPNFTLIADTSGLNVECEYSKDLNKIIDSLCNAIVNLGGTI